MKRRAALLAAAALAVVALLVAVNVAHRVLDSTRGTPLDALRDDAAAATLPPVGDAGFAELVTLLGGTPLTGGNSVQLLTAADTSYALLFADLRSARSTITLQSYYCLPGLVADTTVAILTERARAGVRVLVLGDGYGCRLFAQRYHTTLAAAGVEFALLRPVHWYAMHRAQHRSHVRLAVIDGRIAHTGGFGLDDKWLHGTAAAPAWRDTNVRLLGPVARQIQAAFALAWAEATRALIVGEPFLPHAAAEPARGVGADPGGVVAGIQFAGPGFGTTAFERLVFMAIAAAQHRVYIANAYFLPNRAQRALLADAARRGVDVRVLTAGDRSDVPSTRFASRAHYGELLGAGVRLYEYEPAMMHAKTIVVDGVLGLVGTMNFDNRSMRLGDELNLVVYDTAVGRALEQSFLADLCVAAGVGPEAHAARPLRQRLLERAARLIEPLM